MDVRRAGSAVSTSHRLVTRIRWIVVRGVAAAVSGVLVLGVGGRLVMFISRVLHPDAAGRITENGNRIGEFTVDGTIELIVFGGLLSGVVAGVVWVLTREWIPDNPAMVGAGAVSIGGFALVEADNRDFAILVDPRVDLVLLLALLFLFGMALHRFDHVFERRLPPAGGTGSTAAYSLIAVLGVPFLIPTFGNFFSQEFCFCESPPVWTGVFLMGAAAATVGWWLLDLRGASKPPTLQRLALVLVAAAALAGGVHLAGQIIEIV